MTKTDYAWVLVKQGRTGDACTQIEAAIGLCSKLNNKTQITKLNALLAEINKST